MQIKLKLTLPRDIEVVRLESLQDIHTDSLSEDFSSDDEDPGLPAKKRVNSESSSGEASQSWCSIS